MARPCVVDTPRNQAQGRAAIFERRDRWQPDWLIDYAAEMIDATTTDLRRFRPRLTAYIPHAPTPKQRAFLLLPEREAFYGGAAGGGKSDALLMGALQYVDVPGYHALIIRKTLADAKKPGSIMFRAREWLSGTPARWVADENAFYFPTRGLPAVLKFGKLANIGDAYEYQGSDYQYIGFDELTHFYESDFEYVTTRLRRGICPYHNIAAGEIDWRCASCREYAPLYRVPLRVRTASNPGGLGHIWVKRRYAIQKIPGRTTPSGRPLHAGTNPDRPHIPAFIEDNPFLDQQSYIQQLKEIEDPVTREQLLSGDWGISEDGRFKQHWAKRYNVNHPWYEVGERTWRYDELEKFLIMDPAASKVATPGKQQLTKKLASHTACLAFALTPDGNLLVLDARRHQKEAPDTKAMLREMAQRWHPCSFIGMEYSTMSAHLFQVLQAEGINLKAFSPYTGDKIARSVDIANRMEQGRFWLPQSSSHWLQDLEDELWTWTGHPAEVDDQVDCCSYAGLYMSERFIGYQSPITPGVMASDNLPSVETT